MKAIFIIPAMLAFMLIVDAFTGTPCKHEPRGRCIEGAYYMPGLWICSRWEQE